MNKTAITIVVPVVGLLFAGFGWAMQTLRSIDAKIGGMDTRLAVMETRIETHIQQPRP